VLVAKGSWITFKGDIAIEGDRIRQPRQGCALFYPSLPPTDLPVGGSHTNTWHRAMKA
jgi:hypothetical protein